MKRLPAAALAFLAACAGPTMLNRARAADPEAADSLYWKAVWHLDASHRQGSTDTAITALDVYLANGAIQKHRSEAMTLRRLARDAQQLARLQAALQQAKTADAKGEGRDEEALKEIQRLKDELAKANEELERIRKRLATPKPPAS